MRQTLMRLLPRSLFSRLVLVLLGALVSAQLFSLAIHMNDRVELLARASGMQSAQRIADIVRLLDTLDPEMRPRIVAVLGTPQLAVRLNAPARPATTATTQSAYTLLFAATLSGLLGTGRNVEVALAQGDPSRGPPGSFAPGGPMHSSYGRWAEGPGMPNHPGGGYFSRPGHALMVEVGLRDGTRVSFDSRQPAEVTNWPYRVLLILAVLLVAVIGATLIAVRLATRPLATLADAAERLGMNINHAPLAEEGPVEVVRAARAFNLMQSRLVRFINDRTRILAAMSHDLKTPITRLRLRAELLDDAQLKGRFVKDLEEMESMVGATLDFMRGLGSEEARKPLDVMALLESLQEDMRETGGEVSVQGAVQGPWMAKPQALKRCLANLIENAVKYGGVALITVTETATELEIRIRDRGPGIPPAELEKVFEPFYRLEESRNRETGGTGLGLTIARAIAESHSGRLILRNADGGGLEACLTLPRMPPA